MKKLLRTLVIWLNKQLWPRLSTAAATNETWSSKLFMKPGHRIYAYDTTTLQWSEVNLQDTTRVRYYGAFISILMSPGVEYVSSLNLANAQRHLTKKLNKA